MAGKRFGRSNGSKVSEDDQRQLFFWTNQLVELGSTIIQMRLDFIEKINALKNDLYLAEIRYSPNVKLGDFGQLGDISSIQEVFQNQIDSGSDKELLIGQTLVGPHRDDWHLESGDRNLNLFGSRGEKRMAITDIIFKMNFYLKEILDDLPVMLLDDITSELDEQNIKQLFEKKLNPRQQTIITTTDLAGIPKSAVKNSQIINL